MNKTLTMILAPVLVAGGLAGCARDVPQHTTPCPDPSAHMAEPEYAPEPSCEMDDVYETLQTPTNSREAYRQARRLLARRDMCGAGDEERFALQMLSYLPFLEGDSGELQTVLRHTFTGMHYENTNIGYLSDSTASQVEIAMHAVGGR